MIHQHILAAPRPGLSDFEFQDYWRYVHALKFARKIPQIVKYKVNSKVLIPGQPRELNFPGIAEIWLESEETQAESLRSPEFLEGAVRDEPNWAASWQTLALDTDAHEISGSDTSDKDFPEYKLMMFHKKRRDMEIDRFREMYLADYADSIKKAQIPYNTRILNCLLKRNLYTNSSAPPFDAVTHLSAGSLLELKEMVGTMELQKFLDPEYGDLSEWWGVVTVAVRSEWIVGPQERLYL